MTEPVTLPPGTVLAEKFRIVGLLGVGAMGAVYDVEHVHVGKRYALKVLHASALSSPDAVARFRREMKADAMVQSPHVVEVHDAGTLETGQPYILMQRLEGPTLASLCMRPERLAWNDVCSWIAQACDGVQAAHDAGVLHRDLKPANLLLTKQEGKPLVKILDFGIAKLLRAPKDELMATADGAVVGTPYYMAPEQLRGQPYVDPRVDIYALGVILYECLTGQVPYPAESLSQLGMLVAEGKPTPLSVLRPDVPESLRSVVRQAMAVKPEHRFQTAHALGEALRSFLEEVPSTESMPMHDVSREPMRQTEVLEHAERKQASPRRLVSKPVARGIPLLVLSAACVALFLTMGGGEAPMPKADAMAQHWLAVLLRSTWREVDSHSSPAPAPAAPPAPSPRDDRKSWNVRDVNEPGPAPLPEMRTVDRWTKVVNGNMP